MVFAKFLVAMLILWHSLSLAQSAVLKVPIASQPVTLDPAATSDAESLNVSENIFEGLLQYKKGTLELEPCLAKSWDVDKSGLRYTFKLRRGVKFHDGTPLNAQSVVFSLLRQHDTRHEAHSFSKVWDYWHATGLARLVKAVAAKDEETVEIELNEVSSNFLVHFAMPFTSIVSPTAVRKHKERFAFHPVGTGPFRFVSAARSENIVLEKFGDYWGAPAASDRVLFKIIPDSATRFNAFLKGEVHFLNAPSAEQVTRAQNEVKANVKTAPSLNVSYLAFNTQKGPLRDARVRKALSLALDKETFVRGIFGKHAKLAVGPMPPIVFGYNSKIKNDPQNLNKARALLKEAGFENGFRSSLYFPSVSKPSIPNGKQMAEVLKESFKKINVDVELSTFEWGTYLSRAKNGEHDMVLLGWTGDNADPQNFLHYLLSSQNAKPPATNVAFFKNAAFDALLAKAEKELDASKRRKLYEEAQEIFHREAPWIPLAHVEPVVLTAPNIVGFFPGADGARRLHEAKLIKGN